MSLEYTEFVLYNGVWHIHENNKTKCGIPCYSGKYIRVPQTNMSKISELEDYIEKYYSNPKLCRNCVIPYFGMNHISS